MQAVRTFILRHLFRHISFLMLREMPFPCWLKDSNSVMIWVNDAYVDVYLKPAGLTPDDCIGAHESDVWGYDTATKFRTSDLEALTKGVVIINDFFETFPGSGISERVCVGKWAVKIHADEKAVAGIALDLRVLKDDRQCR